MPNITNTETKIRIFVYVGYHIQGFGRSGSPTHWGGNPRGSHRPRSAGSGASPSPARQAFPPPPSCVSENENKNQQFCQFYSI